MPQSLPDFFSWVTSSMILIKAGEGSLRRMSFSFRRTSAKPSFVGILISVFDLLIILPFAATLKVG